MGGFGALAVVALFGAAPGGGAMTDHCPLDGTPVRIPAHLVGKQSGLRLDLRPVGDVPQTAQLARCPLCQFVWGPEPEAGDLDRLRGLVATPEYREQSRHRSDHALRASILKVLSPESDELAFEWLRASWELEDDDPVAWRRAAEQALAEFARSARAPPGEASYFGPSPLEKRRTAQLMQVELLRRLGRFVEARATLGAFAAQPEMNRGVYVTLLRVERGLIDRKDSQPQPFPTIPPFDPNDDDPAFIVARSLRGFATFDAAFILERASFGHINNQPYSLHMSLQSRKPRPLDSVWWWDFADGEVPRFDWGQLLATHSRAEVIVAKNKWLTDWKSADRSRRVELQLAGLESNTETDLEASVLPQWHDAGFRQRPVVELLLREGSRSCANVFLDQGGGGIATSVSASCGKQHWLTAVPVGNRDSYLRVSTDGRHELRAITEATDTSGAP